MEAAFTDTAAWDTRGPQKRGDTPPCFTAHMQSFSVFWRRFFLSTKSKAKELTCPWRSGGENPVTKGRLPGQ